MSTPLITEETYQPDFHLFKYTGFMHLLFDRLADDKNGIWCEASVWAENETTRVDIVPPTRINLLNQTRTSWRGIAETISDYSGNAEWLEAVKEAVTKSILAFRRGEDPVELIPFQTKIQDHNPFLIEPFVASSRATIFYAQGGLGKSMFALGAGLSVATGAPILGRAPTQLGPVLYCDYEDSADAHLRRLDSLMLGHDVTELKHPIFHKSLHSKIPNAATELRKLVVKTGAKLVIVDSIGMARGGDLNSGEDTIRLFRALNSFSVPVIGIDHVSSDDMKKSAEDGSVAVKPIGSSYTYNSARLAWFMARLPSSVGAKTFIKMTNTKYNHVAKQEDAQASITWGERHVEIDIHDTAWQQLDVGAWELIYAMLLQRGYWVGVPEIEQFTGISSGTILKTLSRHEADIEVKETGGGRTNAKVVRLKT